LVDYNIINNPDDDGIIEIASLSINKNLLSLENENILTIEKPVKSKVGIEFKGVSIIFYTKKDEYNLKISSGSKTKQTILIEMLFESKDIVLGIDFDERIKRFNLKVSKKIMSNSLDEINRRIGNFMQEKEISFINVSKEDKFINGGINSAEINPNFRKYITY
jgi:hypothetical protein